MKGKTTINRDNVVKSGDPRLMRVEVEKTRHARIIGEESGLFRVPEMIEFDPLRGVAVFKKIEGLVSYREAFVFDENYRDAARRLGEALAIIHRDLILPDDMVEPLPQPLALKDSEIFFH